MTGHVITWNGVPSTVIPGFIGGPFNRSLVGTQRGQFIDTPGREGSWFFGEAPGRRKISCECAIVTESVSTRRAAVAVGANWLDLRGQYKLILDDEPDVYYEAVLSDPPDIEEWRNGAQFTLAWQVNPFSLDIVTTSESWSGAGDSTHTWDVGGDVYNYPVISITPDGGYLEDARIRVNGDTLNFDLTGILLNDGATMVINGPSTIVTQGANTDTEVTGVYDTSSVFMRGVSGKFPVLLPGSNTIEFFIDGDSTATSVDIVVLYRNRYRK